MGYMPNLFTKDLTCETCKEKCWVAGDNAATQANAMAMFGTTPNKCVNGKGGVIHCPYGK